MSDARYDSHESLTPDGFTTLFRGLGELQAFPPETELFSQGTLAHEVYLIEAGWVKFTLTDHEGREVVVALRSPGKLLGAAALVSRNPLPVTAVTLTECQIYRLSATRFLKQMELDREFLLRLTQAISQQYYEQTEHLARLGTLSARARLAYLLLQFVPEATKLTNGEYKLPLPFNRATLAGWLAISPEHLSRSLKVLEQDGVIRRSKGWIYVSNLERLTREAA